MLVYQVAGREDLETSEYDHVVVVVEKRVSGWRSDIAERVSHKVY
jgi:hypothetical protein